MSELLKINVNEHTEKKNGLTYLSWAWAWAEVLKVDPTALWHIESWGPDKPFLVLPDGSMMVSVNVAIKGFTRGAVLPVMDHRNKAIKNPDAFAVNTAIQRCLAKAIAMHGLGLYIYAGEDLPEPDEPVKAGTTVSPLASAGVGVSDERKAELDELATYIIEAWKDGQDQAVLRCVQDIEDNDDKVYLWSLLRDSKLRAFLKEAKK